MFTRKVTDWGCVRWAGNYVPEKLHAERTGGPGESHNRRLAVENGGSAVRHSIPRPCSGSPEKGFWNLGQRGRHALR